LGLTGIVAAPPPGAKMLKCGGLLGGEGVSMLHAFTTISKHPTRTIGLPGVDAPFRFAGGAGGGGGGSRARRERRER
jgi:hypothetical protein